MDDIIRNLSALGFAYNCLDPNINADPEKSILDSISHIHTVYDMKLLKLILGWLKHYGDLIHLERLKHLVLLSSDKTKSWVCGIAEYMSQEDRRWNIIKKTTFLPVDWPKNDFLDIQIERIGADVYFKKYGVIIPCLDLTGVEKKILRREHTLRNHFWFRLRALFGSNWRADIVWQIYRDPEQTAYKIAKNIGCTTETAYRNLKTLEQANIRDFISLGAPKNQL